LPSPGFKPQYHQKKKKNGIIAPTLGLRKTLKKNG
jgi:hypothetical protein